MGTEHRRSGKRRALGGLHTQQSTVAAEQGELENENGYTHTHIQFLKLTTLFVEL